MDFPAGLKLGEKGDTSQNQATWNKNKEMKPDRIYQITSTDRKSLMGHFKGEGS